jgi:hypothetical protein
MSPVTEIDECPSTSDTTLSGTPFMSMRLAAE